MKSVPLKSGTERDMDDTANNNNNKYASYPHWHISPHADHHHQPVCHMWFTTVRPVCLTWLYGCPMHYRFFTFWPLAANHWANIHQTWRRCALGAFPSYCKISARSRNRSRRCALPNFFLNPIEGSIGGRRPLPSEISAQSDPPPSKRADFDRFPLIMSQL